MRRFYLLILIILTYLCNWNYLYSAPFLAEINNVSTTEKAALLENGSQKMSSNYSPLEDVLEGNSFNYWQEFFRMMLILSVILGVVLILAWFLRRFLNSRQIVANRSNMIRILERRTLSQKSVLYLVEVNGKQLLIADSASGVRSLSDCPPQDSEEEVTEKDLPKKATFAQILQQKISYKLLGRISKASQPTFDYDEKQ